MEFVKISNKEGKQLGYIGASEQVKPCKKYTEEVLKHNGLYKVEVRITEHSHTHTLRHKPVGTVVDTYWMYKRDDLGRPAPRGNAGANLLNGQWLYPLDGQQTYHHPITD